MTRTLSFSGDYPWALQPGGRKNRPYSELKLYDTAGSLSATILCVVDSGADFLILDDAWLSHAGYSASGTTTATTAGLGTITLNVYHKVDVEVEGNRVTLAEARGGTGVADLLGCHSFLTAIEVGFDSQGWLFRP